jgi:hypothetical protein
VLQTILTSVMKHLEHRKLDDYFQVVRLCRAAGR